MGQTNNLIYDKNPIIKNTIEYAFHLKTLQNILQNISFKP